MQPCYSTLPSIFESEDKFNEYFNQDLNEDDKAYIFAVVTRLRRILNWDPGHDDDNAIFEKQRGRQIVRSALSYYMSWKEFIFEAAGQDTPRLQHLVIYSLAKLCFLYWVQDTRIVSEVLREMFLCDGHFSSMFAHILNRYDRRSLWRHSSQYSRTKEDSAAIYFVHHAYKAKLRYVGYRFVDIPVRHPLRIPPAYLAAIYSRPQLLLQFLCYGAKVEMHENEDSEGWTLQMLLRHLIRILWNALGDDLQHIDTLSSDTIIMSNTVHDVVECLRILLRVIPQIRMDEMNFLLMKFNHRGVLSGSFSSHEFIRLLSGKELVPKFINRYLEPSDLRHLCRCSIRSCLNRHWNLPYGIYTLPIPSVLKLYLSLGDD